MIGKVERRMWKRNEQIFDIKLRLLSAEREKMKDRFGLTIVWFRNRPDLVCMKEW